MSRQFHYIIVGGGLAGASAIPAIRERDRKGDILLIGEETAPPYHRPPLTKDLWFGEKKTGQVFVEPPEYYERVGVTLALGTTVTSLDAGRKRIRDESGQEYEFDKLLLATGGTPKRLEIPGGDASELCYFRTIRDFERISQMAKKSEHALVIGGGFIGSEIAAALSHVGLEVTMLFPDQFMCSRVFPPPIGMEMSRRYRERGINIITEDSPITIAKEKHAFHTGTANGSMIKSDRIVAGIGIAPAVSLAESGSLLVKDGIHVNDRLQTSHPDIYAAGDNANVYYPALGRRYRFEHWDAAMTQGEQAGANMAGADTPYERLPYFYADLFDFGYEAVGDTDPLLDIEIIWKEENETGVVFYMSEKRLKGAMMCNVWDKVDTARRIIASKEPMTASQLKDAFELN